MNLFLTTFFLLLLYFNSYFWRFASFISHHLHKSHLTFFFVFFFVLVVFFIVFVFFVVFVFLLFFVVVIDVVFFFVVALFVFFFFFAFLVFFFALSISVVSSPLLLSSYLTLFLSDLHLFPLSFMISYNLKYNYDQDSGIYIIFCV